MKKFFLLVPLLALTGCIMTPKGMVTVLRPIADNKSAHIEATGAGWHITIDTRAAGDTNNAPLPPLMTPQNPK